MSKRSVMHIKKNSPTTIEFNLEVSGIENAKKTSAVLMVENVIKGCDVAIHAKHVKDTTWSVTVPNLKNFKGTTYNVRLEVVVDGYHFTPASGTIKLVEDPKLEMFSDEHVEGEMLNEGINSGEYSVTGPETEVTNADAGRPEFEPTADDIDNKQDYPIGTNDDDNTDPDKLDSDNDNQGKEGRDAQEDAEHTAKIDAIVNDVLSKAGISQKVKKHDVDKGETKIDDIASSVNSVEGPQLPFDDIDLDDLDIEPNNDSIEAAIADIKPEDIFDVTETVNQMLRTMIPKAQKPAKPGKLISKTVKAKISGDKTYLKEVEEKNKKIRKALK
jgi:hypothetical protein